MIITSRIRDGQRSKKENCSLLHQYLLGRSEGTGAVRLAVLSGFSVSSLLGQVFHLKAASMLNIETALRHLLGFSQLAMYFQSLLEPRLREEGQGAGGAHRSHASQEALYLATSAPKCLLFHNGRRVAREGCLA